MTRAREQQIDPTTTSYYHCVNRCVRRAFLCGEDAVSGKNYDHRKRWVVERLKVLAQVFSIKICAYAVMSNHYHVVLNIDVAQAAKWSLKEVAQRWRQLFKGDALVERWLQGESLDLQQEEVVAAVLELWRGRLTDISWFMRCLNEDLARRANKEDGCKGRFWEGRFRSQALLDEAAVLGCMMYVDLNPVRAGIASSLQASDFTSIQQRLAEFAQRTAGRPAGSMVASVSDNVHDGQGPALMAFADEIHNKENKEHDAKYKEVSQSAICDGTAVQYGAQLSSAHIAFSFKNYCELIDWTGRAVRDDKAGHIPAHIRSLLHQLEFRPDKWVETVSCCGHRFPRMMGRLALMQQVTKKLQQRWCCGFKLARQCYERA